MSEYIMEDTVFMSLVGATTGKRKTPARTEGPSLKSKSDSSKNQNL